MMRGLKLIIALFAVVPVVAPASSDSRVWDFSVLLDGSPIGSHRFELSAAGQAQRLVSEASFDVSFLFFNAYKYRHSNTEIWKNDCLTEFSARTQVNKKRLAVTGSLSEEGFVVDDGESQEAIEDCVMTFAYWNTDFLKQRQLLNPQSGEYLEVEVQELPPETISVRGETTEAKVYRLSAREMNLKLWYSNDDEWLALESTAKGGRIIRYELT